jgi:hypothetical protein
MVPARWFYGLAAAFALAALGLSTRVAVLEQQLASPIFDPPLEEIHLNAAKRNDKIIRVPPSAQHLMLFLVIEGRDFCTDYRVEILDSDGRVLGRKTDLQISRRSEVRLWVPRRQWHSGSLHFRLRARCDGQEVDLDEKSIPIEMRP